MTICRILLSVVFISCLPIISHAAGELDHQLWVANGPVNAIASHDVIDHLFVDGEFSYTAPGSGAMAISAQAGQFDIGFPQINGPVYALVSDGVGGWYIGGKFTHVAGVARNNLAYVSYITGSGWVVEDWNPGVNDAVYALAVSRDGATIYAGGAFTTVNHGAVPRHYIAAILAANGTVKDWDPGINSSVRTMQQSGDGSILYIGGDFSWVEQGVKPRQYAAAIGIAELDANDQPHPDYGQALAWDPDFDSSVYAMAISGTRMFIGGTFTLMKGGSVQRQHAVAVSLAGSAEVDTAWKPAPNDTVRAITLSGSRVYLGGDFTTLNSDPKSQPYLAIVDNSNGFLVNGWRPGLDAAVHSLLLSPDGLLYAGGDFTHVNGQERNRLVALDQSTGFLDDWRPSSWATVHALSGFGSVVLSSGGFDRESRSLVYLGGAFDYVGPETGSAVLLDAAGIVDATIPQVVGTVYSIAPDGSGGWFLGGDFTTVGGLQRRNLAHIDATGLVTAWAPDIDGPVYTLKLSGSGSVYVGGDFSLINGISRPYLGKVTTSDGVLLAWDPQATGIVRTLLIDAGVLYVGGDFSSLGGLVRNHLAAVNPIDASTIPGWDANANAPVLTLQKSMNSSVDAIFAGGSFTQINGSVIRTYLAELATVDGQVTGWDAAVSAPVRSLWLDGARLYVGGDFFSTDGITPSIGGLARNYLAAVDSATGSALAGWRSDANAAVNVIVQDNTELYVGGEFTLLDGVSRNRLAQLSVTDGQVLAWNPSVGGDVYAIDMSIGQVFAGGGFAAVGGLTRRNLAALDVLTGQANDWNPGVDGVVNSLHVSGSNIYIGGQFSSIGGQFRNNLAAVDKNSGLATQWNPDANGAVNCIKPTRDNRAIFVGGEFSEVSTFTRNGLAEININGVATVWDAGLDSGSVIHSLAVSPANIYVAGDLQLTDPLDANNLLVHYLAAFDITSSRLLDWRPAINDVVKAVQLSVDLTRLYIGGDFTRIDNVDRALLAALDPLATPDDDYVVDWVADIGTVGASVEALVLSRDYTTLYIGGQFDAVGGMTRQNLAAVLTTKSLTRADWNVAASGKVLSLLTNNDDLFVGGQFLQMADQARSHVARLQALAAETQPPQTTVSLPGGNYNSLTLQNIALSCDDDSGSGCAITYYSLDGGPWLVYSSPITLRADTVLRFFSVDQVGNSEDSVSNEVHYLLEVMAPTTTISPRSGVFDSDSLVLTLTCVDEDSGCAATYYTLDDSTPTTSSILYTGPFRISGRTVVKYFSIDQAGNREDVRRASYISSQGGSGWLGAVVLLVLVAVSYLRWLAKRAAYYV